MTYKDWNGNDRSLQSLEDFELAENILFRNSPFLRKEFDFASLAGKNVLDLGCGSGVLSIVLARNNADVTAVDLTENAIKMTRENSNLQKEKIKIVRADAEYLSFANDTFDYVISWGVIHHSENTEKAICEVARILKPNGKGLIMVYHKSSFFYYLKGLIWLILKGKIFKGYRLATVIDFYVDGYFHRHFTKKELINSLKSSKLIPEKVFTTQQEQKILPLIPSFLDLFLKRRFGWYLVSYFRKP